MAKTPLSASSIRRSGRSRVQPIAAHSEFLIAKFCQLEHPVTPSKQRGRALSNRQISEPLYFASWRRCRQISKLEPLTCSSSSSTFDGYVFALTSTILGTVQAEPVSNVLGTRPN